MGWLMTPVRACESIQIPIEDRHIDGRNELSLTSKSCSNANRKLTRKEGHMIHRAALAFAILASATTFSAFAETMQERQACTPDAQNLCADEIPDRERVYECLVRKVNQLNPACKKIISSSIAPSKSKK